MKWPWPTPAESPNQPWSVAARVRHVRGKPPARVRARAHCRIVEPVVTMSSMTRIGCPATDEASLTTIRPETLLARSERPPAPTDFPRMSCMVRTGVDTDGKPASIRVRATAAATGFRCARPRLLNDRGVEGAGTTRIGVPFVPDGRPARKRPPASSRPVNREMA